MIPRSFVLAAVLPARVTPVVSTCVLLRAQGYVSYGAGRSLPGRVTPPLLVGNAPGGSRIGGCRAVAADDRLHRRLMAAYNIQVRDEERFLQRSFGLACLDHRSAVRRRA